MTSLPETLPPCLQLVTSPKRLFLSRRTFLLACCWLTSLAIGPFALETFAQTADDAQPRMRGMESYSQLPFTEGRWGLIAVDVTNPGPAPAAATVGMYFTGDPNVEYDRRLWVPPRAMRRAVFPALAPSPLVSAPGPQPRVRDCFDYQGAVTQVACLGFDYDDVG